MFPVLTIARILDTENRKTVSLRAGTIMLSPRFLRICPRFQAQFGSIPFTPEADILLAGGFVPCDKRLAKHQCKLRIPLPNRLSHLR